MGSEVDRTTFYSRSEAPEFMSVMRRIIISIYLVHSMITSSIWLDTDGGSSVGNLRYLGCNGIDDVPAQPIIVQPTPPPFYFLAACSSQHSQYGKKSGDRTSQACENMLDAWTPGSRGETRKLVTWQVPSLSAISVRG
jgi:hypothetical protein